MRRWHVPFVWRLLVAAIFLCGAGALAFAAVAGPAGTSPARPPAPSQAEVPPDILAPSPEAGLGTGQAQQSTQSPASPARPPTSSPAPPRVVNDLPPVRILIPAIRVDAEVMTLGMDAQAVPQVPDRTNSPRPGAVVAWYDFTAPPGRGSNAVFAGHVTWNRAPAVFWALGQLTPGDQVRVVVRDGRQLLYEVTETFMVDPSQPDAIRVMYPTSEDVVTLITCGGTFVPDRSSPLGGDYTHRVVVRAKLVGVEGSQATG